MSRVCTVCQHPERDEIDRAIVSGVPNRRIAAQFAVTEQAVRRHKKEHLPATLVQSAAAAEIARADDLHDRVQRLLEKAIRILDAAETQGDFRTALLGIREARGCLELLAELTKQLDRRTHVNVLLSPEWLRIKETLLAALWPYPEIRADVAARLLALEANHGSVG